MATPDDSTEKPGTKGLLKPVLVLAALAAVLAALLTVIAQITRDRTEDNRQAWIADRLDALLPRELYDNDPLADRIEVVAPDSLGTAEPVSIYRARRNGMPVAAVIRPIAPGYRDNIELLVAIAYDGTLIGVQVIRHNETPGLGDAFENRDADWLDRFRGRSLTDPPQKLWAVRKDGGEFDQFTGATITARAIVKAVRSTLEFYGRNRQQVFDE